MDHDTSGIEQLTQWFTPFSLARQVPVFDTDAFIVDLTVSRDVYTGFSNNGSSAQFNAP